MYDGGVNHSHCWLCTWAASSWVPCEPWRKDPQKEPPGQGGVCLGACLGEGGCSRGREGFSTRCQPRSSLGAAASLGWLSGQSQALMLAALKTHAGGCGTV